MLSDFLFTDASWLFFAIWSIVIGTISVAAFTRDQIPSKAPAESKNVGTAASAVPPAEPGRRLRR